MSNYTAGKTCENVREGSGMHIFCHEQIKSGLQLLLHYTLVPGEML